MYNGIQFEDVQLIPRIHDYRASYEKEIAWNFVKVCDKNSSILTL